MGARRGLATGLSVAALVLGVPGCGLGAEPAPGQATGRAPERATERAAARDAASGSAPRPPAAAPGGHTDEHADLPPAEPYPTWDAAARADAVATATAAMTTFARPALDEPTWWAQLRPLLSPAAAAAYAGTDPANVPARSVTGPGTLTDDSSTYLAPVAVPTDVGSYLVLLSRAGQGSPWLVERFTPPETVNHS